nr:peroxisomal hydratase-dehydrogenase-epimerase [Quercus suber]
MSKPQHMLNAAGSKLNKHQELHPKFSVFPTYPILLPFKRDTQEVIDFYAANAKGLGDVPGLPKLDARRVLDGERQMFFYKPLPTTSAGRQFETRQKIIGVYDKGKSTVMKTQTDLVDAKSGDVYTRIVGSAFYVGQGGWGGPKGPKDPSFNPPEGKKPDVVFEHATNAESAHLYRLNGDYNPLHATPEPGKAMGFGGAIMHGLFSWNTTAHGLVKLLGGSDATNIKEFAARFASPVMPGDTLVTQVWRMGNADHEGWEEVRFVVSVKGGKLCLSNGRARMRVVNVKQGTTRLLNSPAPFTYYDEAFISRSLSCCNLFSCEAGWNGRKTGVVRLISPGPPHASSNSRPSVQGPELEEHYHRLHDPAAIAPHEL